MELEVGHRHLPSARKGDWLGDTEEAARSPRAVADAGFGYHAWVERRF